MSGPTRPQLQQIVSRRLLISPGPHLTCCGKISLSAELYMTPPRAKLYFSVYFSESPNFVFVQTISQPTFRLGNAGKKARGAHSYIKAGFIPFSHSNYKHCLPGHLKGTIYIHVHTWASPALSVKISVLSKYKHSLPQLDWNGAANYSQ